MGHWLLSVSRSCFFSGKTPPLQETCETDGSKQTLQKKTPNRPVLSRVTLEKSERSRSGSLMGVASLSSEMDFFVLITCGVRGVRHIDKLFAARYGVRVPRFWGSKLEGEVVKGLGVVKVEVGKVDWKWRQGTAGREDSTSRKGEQGGEKETHNACILWAMRQMYEDERETNADYTDKKLAGTLWQQCFLATRPDPTNQRPTARHPVEFCWTAVLREPFTIFRTRVRSTRRCTCTLTFGCLTILHDVLHLSSCRQSLSMFLTSCCPSQSTFLTSCQSQSMFLTVAAGTLTQVSRAMSNVHPRCGTLLFSCIRAFPSGPSVSSPYQRDFHFPALFLLRALRQSPSTQWRPLAHVAWPPLPCRLTRPPRQKHLTHSWSTRRTQLRLSSSPPHFELLLTRQRTQHHERRRSRPTCLRVSCPVAVWEDVHDWLFRLSAADDQASRTFLQESHQTFKGLHVLGVQLLHSPRKLLHCELQLTPVLTEEAGPHRPRSVASSILSTKLLAIFFISRPNTWRTHCFAFVVQSHLRHQDLNMSRVCLELSSFASLCAWRTQSHQPVQVDCFLHVSHLRIGSQHSCRLDQQMLHHVVVDLFFLCRPYVTKYSGPWTRTHKTARNSFSVGSSLTRKMMTTRIVSAESLLVTMHTDKIPWSQMRHMHQVRLACACLRHRMSHITKVNLFVFDVLLWVAVICGVCGLPRASLRRGAGVPWVLIGTHQRAVTSRQDDVTAERQTFVVGVVVKSCGLGRGHHGEMCCCAHSVRRWNREYFHNLSIFPTSTVSNHTHSYPWPVEKNPTCTTVLWCILRQNLEILYDTSLSIFPELVLRHFIARILEKEEIRVILD